jgi:hypothetical protein
MTHSALCVCRNESICSQSGRVRKMTYISVVHLTRPLNNGTLLAQSCTSCSFHRLRARPRSSSPLCRAQFLFHNRERSRRTTGTRAAEDVVILSSRRHGADNARKGKVGDGDARCRDAGRASVLIVLLDDDAVVADVVQSNARICDVRNQPAPKTRQERRERCQGRRQTR